MPRTTLPLVCLFLLAGCLQSGSTATPAASVHAPNTEAPGIVHGVVVDQAIIPVAGVAVLLTGGGEAWNATTDEDGGFRIGPLASGAYAVEVEHPSFLARAGPGAGHGRRGGLVGRFTGSMKGAKAETQCGPGGAVPGAPRIHRDEELAQRAVFLI